MILISFWKNSIQFNFIWFDLIFQAGKAIAHQSPKALDFGSFYTSFHYHLKKKIKLYLIWFDFLTPSFYYYDLITIKKKLNWIWFDFLSPSFCYC